MTLPRRWRILRYLCDSITILAAFAWLYLYLDSIHQRHRAEALIADLKQFPFPNATFADVRDFTIAHGGAPDLVSRIVWDPQSPSPPETIYDRPCNALTCAFDIIIEPRVRKVPGSILASLYYLGIRPWRVGLRFEVVGDHLNRSATTVVTVVHSPESSDSALVDLTYQVFSRPISYVQTRIAPPDPIYQVDYRRFGVLQAHFLQLPSAPVARAYDIDPHCLTAITSVCTHAQLAPSAWADLPKAKN